MFFLEASIPNDLTKEEKKYLREAEKIVSKEYDEDSPKYWGTVTNIFKSKVKKHLGYDPYKKRKKKRKKKVSMLDMGRAERYELQLFDLGE